MVSDEVLACSDASIFKIRDQLEEHLKILGTENRPPKSLLRVQTRVRVISGILAVLWTRHSEPINTNRLTGLTSHVATLVSPAITLKKSY